MLGCWNGGGGFLGLGFLVIGIPLVAQTFQGLRGSLKYHFSMCWESIDHLG
jgi:hypothetical protein